MNAADRIEQTPACKIINLTEAEQHIYTGCGWKLAHFVDGQLIELFDPEEVEYREDVQAMADEALKNALLWVGEIEREGKGEVWLVMCSCYQLCEPRRITLTDAGALAKMARVFTKQFYESAT